MVSLLPRAPFLASLPKPAAAASFSLWRPAMLSPSVTAHAPAAAGAAAARPRKLPVLLFDVMDTIVRDPFYHHIPAFFQMSMKELLESKHPTAWLEFEMGLIDENELAKKFFNDGRSFDLEGLKGCMVSAYEYIDGVEEILCCLKQNNYEMHAFTNYPVWYQLIEDKLKLSKYLSWTFCSCLTAPLSIVAIKAPSFIIVRSPCGRASCSPIMASLQHHPFKSISALTKFIIKT